MITLDRRMGGLHLIRQTTREESGALTARERYVSDCAQVADDYSARVLLNRGLAAGWRFRLLPHGFVDLWAPALWKPVTYTMRNETLWRAIEARGVSLT